MSNANDKDNKMHYIQSLTVERDLLMINNHNDMITTGTNYLKSNNETNSQKPLNQSEEKMHISNQLLTYYVTTINKW